MPRMPAKTPARTRLLALAVLAPVATPAVALAQYEIMIDVENPTLRPGESTVVTLYAGFDSSDYAMASVIMDFGTSVGADGWSDAMLLNPMDGPGTQPGVPSVRGYDDIFSGQPHFPVGAGIFADPTNPIGFWQATYTALLDPLAPFAVDIRSITRDYSVHLRQSSAGIESRLGELVEGSAVIHVIPAPASASLLALGGGGGLLAMRRRR